MCQQKSGDGFLKSLQKSWVSFASLQLPLDCWNLLWTNEAEKQSFIILYKPTKEGINTWQWPIIEWISLSGSITWQRLKKHHVTLTKKEAYKSNNSQHQSLFLTFLCKKSSVSSAASVLYHWQNVMTYNTIASWTNSLGPSMWTVNNVKGGLVCFPGPKLIPFIWM